LLIAPHENNFIERHFEDVLGIHVRRFKFF
jgi:hypothetical protein